MNRPAIIVAALVVAGLVVINLVLGQNLILDYNTVQERGAGTAWFLVWCMVWLTVLCGIALAVFLLASALRGPQRR